MSPPPRRAFAVPAWAERAALAAIGAWLLAYAATSILGAVNTAGAFMLPNEPIGPNSWRPAQPLGVLPFRLQHPIVVLEPVLALAFLVHAFATWGDPAKRRRLLVTIALVDALIVILAYQAVTIGAERSNAMLYFQHQLSVAPLVGIGVALAWRSRPGRIVALAGAALLFAAYANMYWMDHGIEPGSWWTPERFGILVIFLAFARALAPALIGLGILLAARRSSSRAPVRPAPAAALRAPSTR